jgi:nucleoside-diphosphate-sugar epimerase
MHSISILGSGWLGFSLAKELSAKYDIKLSTKTKSKIADLVFKNIEPYLIDIDNLSQTIEEFLESDILIINIPSKNIEAFKNLAQYIEKSQIKKLIFISSTSICRDDKSPLLSIEKIFQDMDKKTTILRFGGLIGYGRNPANFFKNNKIVPNPQTPVNMIHRDDCISIIKEILKQDVFDEVFNCCSPTHPTKKEFYTHCAISSGLPIPLFDTVENKEGYTIIPIEKLQNKLNYKFIHLDLMKIKL